MRTTLANGWIIFGVVVTAHFSSYVCGQTTVNFNVAGPATWNSNPNWIPAFVPDAQFNEIAVIGSNRSAFVDDTPPNVGGVVVGSGTLEVRTGGNLTAVPNTSVQGNLVIGDAGTGSVIVRRGGTLSVQGLSTGGSVTSQLTLGETGGSGTATLQVASGTLNRVTRIVGPNVNFSSAGSLDFGTSSILISEITGPSHSAITVSGSSTLAGVLRPQFNGYTPVLGNSWNLMTAGALSGSFTLDVSQVPTIPRGAGYSLLQTATTATLRYSNKLILSVDRATGQTAISNVLGSPISFDGYSIGSSGGNLDGAWNSLDDQNISAWDEADNSSVSRLTEFNPSGASLVNVGASLALGNPYSPPAPTTFGQPYAEDLSFHYAVPGQGTVNGIVEYTGRQNNLVLTIDPATGGAAIQNESTLFNVEIEGYTVTSASGRLQIGAGQWNSLDDQNLSAWDEADNSSAFRITEFNPQGITALSGGGTVLNLGTPVNTSGGSLNVNDFNFQFALAGGQVLQGIVVLGPLPATTLAGDYDHNGVVNSADYTMWRATFGNSVTPSSGADGNGNGVVDAADYVVWRNALASGSGSTSGATSVPEPATIQVGLLLLVGVLAPLRSRHCRGVR